MSEAMVAGWHEYFIGVVTAGAALTGLLFIGLTLSLQYVLAGKGYLFRAFASVYLQFEAVVVGLFGLVPGQPIWVLGIEWIVTGLAFLLGFVSFASNFPEDPNSVLGSKWPHRIRITLIWLSAILPAAAGACLLADWRGALYLLIPAEVGGLFLSVGNAWVFAVEIPRRAQKKV
jgi:modulator of FtsH protease